MSHTELKRKFEDEKNIIWKTRKKNATLYDYVSKNGSIVLGNWSISMIDAQLYFKHKDVVILITDMYATHSQLEYNKLKFPIDEQDTLYIIHDLDLFCILHHTY